MPATALDPVASFTALQGRWTSVYQEIDGQMATHAVNVAEVMEFQGTEFKVEKNGRAEYEGTFTISGLTSPFSIVLIYRTSAQPLFLGGPRPGVFQVEGDTFKCCFGSIGQPRPRALNTFPGSESVLTIFHRHGARAQPAAQQRASVLHGAIFW
jgi:uncharacterized protein (TIGR03067 family)